MITINNQSVQRLNETIIIIIKDDPISHCLEVGIYRVEYLQFILTRYKNRIDKQPPYDDIAIPPHLEVLNTYAFHLVGCECLGWVNNLEGRIDNYHITFKGLWMYHVLEQL